jgi:hypothetical protein
MSFVQKLIDDTRNGDWNYCWKYSDGSGTYTLNKQKHYLSGLNFTTREKSKELIFPNGYALESEQLGELESAVLFSLEATVDDSVKLYLAGKEITQEQQDLKDEQEAAKPKPVDAKKETPKAQPPDKKK